MEKTPPAEGRFGFEKGEIDRAESAFLQASSLAETAMMADTTDFEKRQAAAAIVFFKKMKSSHIDVMPNLK